MATSAQACESASVPSSLLDHLMAAGVIRSDVNRRQDISQKWSSSTQYLSCTSAFVTVAKGLAEEGFGSGRRL